MYNFTGSSKTLVNDLQWAILQANCYCGDLDGVATVYYDTTSGRYTRSADCLSMRTSGGYDTMDMCANGHIPVIPAFVLSPAKQTFIQGVWGGIDNSVIGNLPYTFYFGLHRNIQMQWMFYDYDKNDFPVTSYTNWGPGYPNGTAQCAKLNSNDGVLVWENYGCNSDATGLSKVLCQGKACDATSTSCCQYCNGNGFEIKEKKPKSRTGKRNKKRLFS
uniref:C-type lectin domain-containing protein n=1 Tax=Acrobeloides nanus TaxID=290746 RepID=A0A914DZ59_9BILA